MSWLSLSEIEQSCDLNLPVQFVDDLYSSIDWNYTIIDGVERDRLLIDLFDFIEQDQQIVGDECRRQVWQDGWTENLDLYRKTRNLDSLVPKFIRAGQIVRFNQQFIRPSETYFESYFLKILQACIFYEYIKEINYVYEFGCGSGFNLVSLANMFPSKQLIGLDFVDSSINLINMLAEDYGWKLKSLFFDMTQPDDTFEFPDSSCVFTFGAIEQLPGQFKRFIDFLVAKKPSLCVHIEPSIEVYDKTNLVDYTAIRFHRKRSYTIGLIPYLQRLHSEKKIDLLKVHRSRFGNLRMEGYTYFVWKTL